MPIVGSFRKRNKEAQMSIALKQHKQLEPDVHAQRAFHSSRIFAAAVVVIFLNFFCGLLYSNVYKANQNLETSSQKQAAHLNRMRVFFEDLKEPPKLVLLGSSVIAVPFFLLDAEQYPETNSNYFFRGFDIKSLDARFFDGKNNAVINMGTDAAMIADCYFLAHKFLLEKYKPGWIVLGVTPRDFSDTGPLKPSDSSQFYALSRISDFPWVSQSYLPTYHEKIDYLIRHLFFFYAQQNNLQTQSRVRFEQLLQRISLRKDADLTTAVDSFSETNPRKKWERSQKEYARHYQSLVPERISASFGFLKMLIALCKEHHIQILLINMPLSVDNQELLPNGFYSNFREQLGEMADSESIPFVDCSEIAEFQNTDFSDGAHLNGFGAEKLLRNIRDAIGLRAFAPSSEKQK